MANERCVCRQVLSPAKSAIAFAAGVEGHVAARLARILLNAIDAHAAADSRRLSRRLVLAFVETYTVSCGDLFHSLNLRLQTSTLPPYCVSCAEAGAFSEARFSEVSVLRTPSQPSV